MNFYSTHQLYKKGLLIKTQQAFFYFLSLLKNDTYLIKASIV